jgi:hypothetical protein
MTQEYGRDFKGYLVTHPEKRFHDGEPVIVFRAQDQLLPDVLEFYQITLEMNNAGVGQLDAISTVMDWVDEWQAENPMLLKIPDHE